MEPTPKKIRKANFSHQELSVLLTELQHHCTLLLTKLQNGVTNKKKQEIWTQIATAVSNVGQNPRSADELKKKWTDMKTQALKYKGHQRGTGGGPPIKEPPFTDIVLDIIGENSELNGVENAPVFDSWGSQTITCINVDLGPDFASAPESVEQKVVLVETDGSADLAREMPVHNTEDGGGSSGQTTEIDSKACCSFITGADEYSACSSSQASALTAVSSIVASNSRTRKQRGKRKSTGNETCTLYDRFLEEHMKSQQLYQDYLGLKMEYLRATMRRLEDPQ